MGPKTCNSLQIFREHIKRDPETGELDASGVISRECYLQWLDAKFALESDAEAMRFHRALTNHVSGVVSLFPSFINHKLTQTSQDGRSPFDPDEEAAILRVFRRKLPWPCFPPHLAHIGKRYRTKGFHEKQRERESQGKDLVLSKPPKVKLEAAATTPPPLKYSFTTDNVEEMFRTLSTKDATYVKDLRDQVVKNFVSADYNLQDWRTINQIFRFMVLSKTTHVHLALTAEQRIAAAQRLCKQFSIDSNTVSMVFDMTSKSYLDRTLVQNKVSYDMFDPLVGSDKGRITDASELYRVVPAVAAAYHQPGKGFWVYQQQTLCREEKKRLFDMCYYVDPETLFLVVFGRPSDDSSVSVVKEPLAAPAYVPLDW